MRYAIMRLLLGKSFIEAGKVKVIALTGKERPSFAASTRPTRAER
jgi:hypothetical protein